MEWSSRFVFELRWSRENWETAWKEGHKDMIESQKKMFYLCQYFTELHLCAYVYVRKQKDKEKF